jgi:Glycosyltransferase sugar-binding region containing DXD motif
LLAVFVGLLLWEPYIELIFYPRKWLQKEIYNVEPLSGCFEPERISERYNFSEALYGRRRTEVQVGMEMKLGMDCYHFAGTVQPEPRSESQPFHDSERVNFHTYWRVDLLAFTERHEWMLKSFFATQDLDRSKLIMWSNGDLSGNLLLKKWLGIFPNAFELRIVDIPELSKGTALEGSKLLKLNDTRAWLDGDLIRLLVLYHYGGVWIDMDSLLTRDLSPLLEHEFVTQWDCYGA